MKIKHFYLILAIFGLIFPYAQFVPWLLENGLDINLLFEQLFANRISAFFGWDVVIAAVVVLVFATVDGRKNNVPYWWLAIVGTLSVGVSFGLPLYLFLRE